MAVQTNQEKLERAEQIAVGLRRMFGEGTEIEVRTVYRRNEELTGFCFQLQGGTLGPTIYLEDMPQDLSLEEQTQEAAARMQEALKMFEARPKITAPCLEREQILQNVVIQALSQEKNKNMLENNAHVNVLDLAAVFRVPVPATQKAVYMSTLIPYELMERENLTEEELYEAAQRNTVEKYGVVVRKMDYRSMQRGMKPKPLDSTRLTGKCGYMLSTNEVNGAALMLIPKVLREVHQNMREDFYIVPSSIHEVILWKESLHYSVESMKQSLYEMNRRTDVVDPTDVLTDSVYFYDGQWDKLIRV